MSNKPSDSSAQGSRALRPVASSSPRALYPRDAARQQFEFGDNLISPAFLLWVFRQWWKFGIPIGLVLAAVVAAAVIYFHVPRYQARALMMIEDTSPYVAFTDRKGGRGSQRYVQTQLEILRSPVVLEPVLSRPEIASLAEFSDRPDRVEALQEGLSVMPLGRSELYNLAYVSRSPESAAAIVNAIAAEYMVFHSDDDSQRSQRVIDILEEERQRRAIEVERLRKRLVALAEEVTGKDPYGGVVTDVQRALNPIGSLFQMMTDTEAEREELKAQLQFLAEAGVSDQDSFESSGLLDLALDNHAEILQKLEAIKLIEARLEEIKNQAIRDLKNPRWETNSTYVALKKELTQRRQDVIDSKAKLREILLVQRREQRKFDREQETEKIKHQLELLDKRNELLSKRFTDQLNELQTGKGKSVELEFARAELGREERVFELIASRKLALQTEMRAPARIQLTRKADVPTRPIEPVPYKLLLVFCPAAFCAPFGLALVKEIMVRRISDVDQLAQESRLRVLGEIAELPVRHVAVSPRKLRGRLQRDAHVFAESINSLRTNLIVAEDLRDKQVLAVMSPSSGEAKSSVSTSLAMSIASATGTPTLIIDGDMRSPDVATMLKTRAQPGLFEVLTGNCRLEDVIQHVGESNLYVIPAGRASRSPHHLVKVDEMNQLLGRLRTKFPTIIIDTPPILGASESIVLAKVADAVLFCSLCGVSRVKQVRLAVERLEHAGANVAGAVLSGSSVNRYAFTYGYYPHENEVNG